MKIWRTYFLIIWVICPFFLCAQKQYRIISYNVENLFHPEHDSLKNDIEFTPEGNKHWTYYRYKIKAENIARVIANISKWDTPMIIGLCEIENDKCLKKLCWLFKNYNYKYIHYESNDERGIDVALLYQPELFQIIQSKPLHVELANNDFTRDILYVEGVYNQIDTLYLMLCHLPSQLSGQKASEWKREKAKAVIQQTTDSILREHETAQIVVMGDMNTVPKEDIEGLNNLMLPIQKQRKGTHKYQGIWTCLDQFYVSSALLERTKANIYDAEWIQEEDKKYLGLRPKRTFIGYRYQKGFSDHLPIYLDITF